MAAQVAYRRAMDVTEAMRAGRRLEEQGEIAQAIAEYGRLADAGVAGAAPLLRMGLLHMELDELAPAMAAFGRAEATEPDAPEPKLRLAQITTSIGRNMAAAAYLEAAIRIAPDLAELRINLAPICSRLDWYDRAYWAVAPLAPEQPDWWAHARKRAIDEFTRARAELRGHLRQRREAGGLDHGLTWELAQRLLVLGRLRMAETLLDRLIAATPEAAVPRVYKARAIARRAGAAAALDYLQGLPEAMHASRDHAVATARMLNDLKRYDEVLATFAGKPDAIRSYDGRFLISVALLSLGRREQLRAHCRDWIEEDPREILAAGVLMGAARSTTPRIVDGAEADAGVTLVQFWDDPDVPPDVAAVLNSWTMPGAAVRRIVYHEEQARAFVRDQLGAAAVATFDLCHHAAMKADYFRLAYLLKVGGVYVDADERRVRPMGALLAQAARAELAAVRSGDLMGYLHNFFMGARPGSAVLALALEEADRAIRTAHVEGRRPEIWHATGPGVVTRAVGRYLAARPIEETEGRLLLLPLQQYRAFVRNASDLDYKRESGSNWLLAD